MKRRSLFASALVLSSLLGCVADNPQPPRVPTVVHIPLGSIGRHEKPTTTVAAGDEGAGDDGSSSEGASDSEVDADAEQATTSEDTPTIVPLDTGKPRSSLLPSGFANPIPNGVFAGYKGDTGLDIASKPHEVYAVAAGVLDYSEEGHTLWVGPKDTHFSVRIALDTPIPWKSHSITHVYYTHLSAIEIEQPENAKTRHHVEPGDALGVSGVANGLPHLHLGFLLDGHVEQDDWTYILTESEIRAVLGKWANGAKLPPS